MQLVVLRPLHVAPATDFEYDRAVMRGAGKERSLALGRYGLAALGLLVPSPAWADPAKSFATDAFSIELGPRPVCFAVPVSLRAAASCKGLPPVGANDFDTTQIGLIAAGGIRRTAEEPTPEGSLAIVGLLQVFQVPASNTKHPDVAHAERVGLDATKAILANLPSEARRSKVASRIEKVDGLVVVRTTVDVDDLTPGTRASFFGHIETSTVFGRDANYTVVWSGPAGATSAAAIGHLADVATSTIRLVSSQRPESRESSTGPFAIFGNTALPIGGTAVAGVIASGLYLRKRRRSQRLSAELWPARGD